MDVRSLQATRIAVCLVQALLLFALYRASFLKVWPATDLFVFTPLVATLVFVPLITISGLGNMRPNRLLVWLGAAALLCAGIAYYRIFRDPPDPSLMPSRYYPRHLPFEANAWWFVLAGLLFAIHALVLSGEVDRRPVATYATYFDVSWKLGVQVALALLFVGVFWAILYLGAALFDLIKLDFLTKLIKEDYFWIPATVLAAGCAIHLTDVAGLARSARALLLFLLCWLLPVVTLLAIAFLAALPFVGLDVLWSTKRAGIILLGAAAALIFFINAAYQDGSSEQPEILRWARLIACLVLLPLIGLAAHALALRVQQYGWTPQRVVALAFTTAGALYAMGYLYATVRFGLALRGLELTNVLTIVAIVGITLALLSPIADPARLSVNNQIARLDSGKVTPEKFDFVSLKFDTGRFGRSAIAALKARTGDEQALGIARRASLVQAEKERYEAMRVVRVLDRPTPEQIAAQIKVVLPSGGALPQSFFKQTWPDSYEIPSCLVSKDECEAILLDLDGDGREEIILLPRRTLRGSVYASVSDAWKYVGDIEGLGCGNARSALREGQFELKEPSYRQIVANGQLLKIREPCAR